MRNIRNKEKHVNSVEVKTPLGKAIFVIAFVAVFALAYFGSKDEIFSCDRAKNVCTIEHQYKSSSKKELVKTIELSSIIKAQEVSDTERTTYHYSDNRTKTRRNIYYSLDLITNGGSINLFKNKKTSRSYCARQINDFLATKKDKLEIINGNVK